MFDIMQKYDEIDRKLLRIVQNDASITNAELGERLAVSTSQANRRRKSLEDAGIIERYVAQLSPAKLGLGIHAFVEVSMSWQSDGAGEEFRRAINTQEEIVGAWALTGGGDYLLSVFTQDLPSLNRLIHEVLLKKNFVSRVDSKIVMDQLQVDAGLPLL